MRCRMWKWKDEAMAKVWLEHCKLQSDKLTDGRIHCQVSPGIIFSGRLKDQQAPS